MKRIISLGCSVNYFTLFFTLSGLFLAPSVFGQTYTMGTAPATNGATITTCSGNFYDSGGNGLDYTNNQNNTVTFCATSPDDKMVLSFSFLSIEQNYDFIYIYDGSSTSAPLLGTYTGTTSPGTITSVSGNCLTVKFTSDYSNVSSGWAATISCTTPSGGAGNYLLSSTNSGTTQTVCTGNFYDSGGSGGSYTNSQDRTMTFCTTNSSDRMRLNFSAFALEAGYDFMYIYDGANTSGTLIGTYTGTNSPGTITSTNTNCLTVRFVSDNSNVNTGWAAAISCVAPATGNSCGLTIKNVNTSGCYINGGVSKATVSVEVAWTNAPSGQTINVTLGSQTKTITPGTISVNYGAQAVGLGSQTIVSPQVVAFEVNADGSSGSVNAVFSGSPTCTDSKAYSLPVSCLSSCSGTELGGTVFNDYDRDGVKDANETSTVGNITVKAFTTDGLIYTTKTDAAGKYSFDIPVAKYPVRIEFSDIPSLYGQGTRNGTDGRTTTQFISAPECNADLGILAENDYCAGNSQIFLPCYVNGNPLVSGLPSTMDAFISFNYGLTGVANSTNVNHLATAAQVGSLWGVAYNRKTNRIFTSATLKRHVGLGPQGLGGLYVINPSLTTGPVTSWNLSSIGINVGTVSNNATRGLTGSLTSPSYDTEAWTNAGKAGIGDIDLSADGNYLYLVNLFDKKLYRLNLTAYNTSGTAPTAADVVSYTIPDPGCTGGSMRPWGLKVYNNKVYVGAVCDAGTSQSKSDLRAYVYEYDPAVNTWYNRLDFPLTYPKGFAVGVTTTQMARTGWYPWSDNFTSKIISGTSWVVYPEPILSDIEFDIDGSLTLGFLDRTSFQTGYQNYALSGTSLYDNSAGGDLIKAYYNNGSFILENNAKAGPFTGSSVGNNQGPGFGEFYNDNWIYSGFLYHAENGLGGLTVRPGSGEVVSINIDPTNETAWSGGLRYYNNSTGVASSSFVVYETQNGDTGTQGKAAGLGDIEVLCTPPTDLEIGNRVWIDADKDGVQDPNESPLQGVKVRLYKGTTLIAETTTDANGEYYFKDNTVVGVTWSGTGADVKVLPNTAYSIVFGKSTTDQFAANELTISSVKYLLTTANSTLGTGNDLNDSDASIASVSGTNYPVITVTTGTEGTIDHTLDAGFYICPTITSPSAAQSICIGSSGSNMTVQTSYNGTNSIRFVAFTTQQTGTNAYTNAGTTLATVTPTGASSPYTATYTWNSADFPNATSAPITYYVYAILNPDLGASCRPVQEIQVTIKPIPSVTDPTDQTVCNGASTTAVTFSGTVTGTTYAWTNNTPSIGLAASGTGNIAAFTATNTGTSPVTATITVTPTANGCTGTAQTFTITVNPTPSVTDPTNQTVCNGTSTTAVTLGGSAVAGTTYSWTNNTTSIGLAASGTGNIAAFTATNATSSPVTATITVTPTANGCTGTAQTFTITVNPTPSVTDPTDQTVCNGTSTTAVTFGGSSVAGTTYSWTNNTTSIGLAASGTGNIAAFTATNTGTSPVTATITVTPTANGCTGTAQTFTITVNPTPSVTDPTDQTVCNGTSTTAVTLGGSSVAGTTYSWTNNTTSIGLAASGTGNIAAFTATNTGTSPVTATITVTPTANGCTGTAQTFTITVNPTPSVTDPADQTVCADATTTAVTLGGSAVIGTTYSWTNNTTSIGLAASGTGNIAAFTATNTGTSPITATITVTPTANGCTGTAQTFTITVNPTPSVTDPTNQTVCNGTSTTAVTLGGSAVAGTTYSWTNNTPSIGLAASGTGNIAAFAATNTGTSPVTATITVTPTANGCTGTAQTFTITVNPTPNTPSVTTPQTNVCPATTVNLTTISSALTPSVSGSVFEWRIGSASSSALVGTPTTVGAGTYYLFEKSSASCYSSAQAVSVNIQTCCPTPNCIPVAVTRTN